MNQQFQIVGTRDDDYSYGVSGLAADTILLGGCFDDRHRGGVHRNQSSVFSLQSSEIRSHPETLAWIAWRPLAANLTEHRASKVRLPRIDWQL